jgi:hypothetical protein
MWQCCKDFWLMSLGRLTLRSHGLRERKGSDPGWVPLNMIIPIDLSEKIKQVIDFHNTYTRGDERPLSLRTFLYTVVVWWCTAVYEYKGPGMLDD